METTELDISEVIRGINRYDQKLFMPESYNE